MQNQHRQLAAILFTDIVGYTALMQQDEQKAVTLIKHYHNALNQAVHLHNGKVLNNYGDGSLCTFPSASEALNVAIELQKELQTEPKVPLRIGLHVGEIFFENEKVLGDAINVASRIQSMGQANTILYSKEILEKVRNHPEYKSVSLGLFEFKNVIAPMEVFALANEGLLIPDKKKLAGKLREKKFSRKKIILICSFILLAILSFFVYRQFLDHTNRDGRSKSIAILPFKEIGSLENGISEGLVEDILVHLSKIRELTKVISNRSSSKYTNSLKSLSEIGDELRVNSLVIGSIQEIGDSIKVNAQLIDCKSGNTLWAENYIKGKKQIFDLETEVATKIVIGLKAKLTLQEERGLSQHNTENEEAYKFYRKGRNFWDKRNKESFDSAEVNFKRAIDLDPDYALAYSGLADIYIYPFKELSALKTMPIAKDYLARALSLDSTLVEALTTAGFIQCEFDYDWTKSKSTLEKAIRLNPNYAMAHVYYGNLLQYTGQNTALGIEEVKKALELDPLSSIINWALGRNYFLAGKIDPAYEQLNKALTIDPKNIAAKGTLIDILLMRKKFNEVFSLIKQLPLRPTANQYLYQGPFLSYAYAAMGDSTRAKKELDKTIAEDPNQSPYLLARCNVILKNYTTAIDQLNQAYMQRDIRIYNYLHDDPALDPIRNEPRFKALLKKANLN